MSYIGNSPGVASQRVETAFTATSNQTAFTPSSGYTLGYCDVYQNGVKLVNGDDYTASDGVTVTLATGAASGDSIVIVASFPRGLSDGYLKSEADAKYVALTGDQTVAGVKTLSSNPILSGGTANGVPYLNGSKVLTSGSGLVFDGSVLGVGDSSPATRASGLSVLGGSGTNDGLFRVGSSTKWMTYYNNAAGGGSYNAITNAGDNLLVSNQYQAMLFGVHDGCAVRMTQTNGYFGTTSGSRAYWDTNGLATHNGGYFIVSGGDSQNILQSYNTANANYQLLVKHNNAGIDIINQRNSDIGISSSSGGGSLYLKFASTYLWAGTGGTRAAIRVARYSLTAPTSVTLDTGSQFTGIIMVYGEGNDTSAAVWVCASDSQYASDNQSRLIAVVGSGYAGNVDLSIGAALSGNFVLTLTGTGSRTYQVVLIGGV